MSNIFGSDVDKELKKLCKKHKAVGVNVALFNNNEILYKYCYGYTDKANNIKSTDDSLYKIGSNTKLFTALAIMKLVEKKAINLDADIKNYIPEFEVRSYFDYNKITIENLLMHRSGLVSDLSNLIYDNTRDYHELIDELKNTYLTSIPGTMFSYSNVGYTLLGILIERVSGMSYIDYIVQNIAKPLGIKIHFFQNNQELEPYKDRIALCYDKKGNNVDDAVFTMIPAGSNTYISLNDLVKFGQIFLTSNNPILKKETLELMEKLNLKDEIDTELMNVSYGIIHNQYNLGKSVGKILGHGGATTYQFATFNYVPNLNVGVIILTNSENSKALFVLLGLILLRKYASYSGFECDNLSVNHKHSDLDCNKYVDKFVTSVGLLDITKNKKNELVTNMAGFPVKLKSCDDGYLQMFPNNLFLNIPFFRRSIMGARIKLIDYYNEEVMILEQTKTLNKNTMILGTRYDPSIIPNSFIHACGKYELANEHYRNNFKCKCSLITEKNILKLNISFMGTKVTFYLKVINDNLAIIQGHGRNAKETIELFKEDNSYYFKYSGILFKQITG